MIDPRFANAGAVPFVPGYGAQQAPVTHHRHRHHRHRKGRHGNGGDSPLSRDESIHKVDHGHQHFQQNQGAQFGGGFGVPYGAAGFGPAPSGFGPGVPSGFGPGAPGGFGPGAPGGFGPAAPGGFGAGGPRGFFPQQPFGGGNFGYGNQFQGNAYAQGQFDGGPGVVRHHRHHHRHHHGEPQGVMDQATGVPEQLIGQRSSSVIAHEGNRVHSPGEIGGRGEVVTHYRHHHHEHEQRHQHPQHHHHHHHQDHQDHHHHHQDHQDHHHHHHQHHSHEDADFGQTHQSRQPHAYQNQNPNSFGVDGYGHINDDLIFIERGDCSPSRQTPPPGYDYKGKIEVQGADTEVHTRSRCAAPCPPPPCIPCPPPSCIPCPPPPCAPCPPPPCGPCPSLPCGPISQAQGMGICPPGWQQMIATAAPGGPCPPGTSMFHGQLVGAAGIGHAGIGGSTDGFGGGPIGASGSGGGLANLAASLPFPPQGQIIADYFVDCNTSGGIGSAGGSSFGTGYQQDGGAGYQQGGGGAGYQQGGGGAGYQQGGGGAGYQQGDGGAGYAEQCCQEVEEHVCTKAKIIEVWQKRQRPQIREKSPCRSRSRTPQPVFDFERFRTDILETIERMVPAPAKLQWTGHDGGTQTQINPVEVKEDRRPAPPGEVRVIVQPIQPVFYMPRQTDQPAPPVVPAIQQAPNVVYVPRNVYVPVIKPVFVPKERVIVRPQVIHVARPVLVDRPVPVTQRPIIIDRERPVPVPVRGAQAAQAGGSRVIREDFVYQDTLPVAYGGRCEEFTGTTNYDYGSAQQEHQYAASSTHEVSNDYQTQGAGIDETTAAQFQHSHSASQLDAQQGGDSFHGSYSNLAQTNSASGINTAPLICAPPIEVHGVPAAPIEILDSTVNPSWQRTDQSSLVRRYGRPAYDIVQKTDQVEQQMYHELRQRSSSGGIQRSDSAASYASGSGCGGGQTFTQEVFHQGQAPIPVRINY